MRARSGREPGISLARGDVHTGPQRSSEHGLPVGRCHRVGLGDRTSSSSASRRPLLRRRRRAVAEAVDLLALAALVDGLGLGLLFFVLFLFFLLRGATRGDRGSRAAASTCVCVQCPRDAIDATASARQRDETSTHRHAVAASSPRHIDTARAPLRSYPPRLLPPPRPRSSPRPRPRPPHLLRRGPPGPP